MNALNFTTLASIAEDRILIWSHQRKKPIVLICGLNGRGKTTLLDAIKLCLYGKFARCSNRKGLSYDDFLLSSIHRGVRASEGASITIHLTIANERAGRLEITRYWAAKGKAVNEDFHVKVDGRFDPSLAEQWDRFIHQVLPVEVSQLFFFDGEQVEQIAEQTNAQETIRLGVKALLGLDLVDQLDKDLGRVVRMHSKKSARQPAIDKITRIEAEKDSIELRLGIVTRELGRTNVERDSSLTRRERLRKRYAELGGGLLDKRDELTAKRVALKSSRDALRQQLSTIAAGSLPLYLLRKRLKQIQEQAQASEDARNGRVIAQAVLSREDELLRILRSLEVSDANLKKAETALVATRPVLVPGDESVHLDNQALKHFSLVELRAERKSASATLQRVLAISADIQDLDNQLIDVPSGDEVAQVAGDMNAIEAELSRLSIRRTTLAEEQLSLNKRLLETGARLEQVSREIAVRQMQDRQELAASARVKTIQGVLAQFRMRAVDDAVESLGFRILEGFRQITGKVDLVSRIVVSKQDFSLELADVNDHVFSADKLSAGERQLLATSILWGLARISGLAIPLVVDTPLGRLDGVHRRLLIENYFPVAAHQVVVLSTDEEIDEARFGLLRPYITRAYSLVFDDDAGCTSVFPGYGNWQSNAVLEGATG